MNTFGSKLGGGGGSGGGQNGGGPNGGVNGICPAAIGIMGWYGACCSDPRSTSLLCILNAAGGFGRLVGRLSSFSPS